MLYPADEGTTFLRKVGYLFTQRHGATSQKIRNLYDVSEILAVKDSGRPDASGRISNVFSRLRQVVPRPSATWLLLATELQLPVRPSPGPLSNKSMVRYWYCLAGENPSTRTDTCPSTQTPYGLHWETTRASMIGSRRGLLFVVANHRTDLHTANLQLAGDIANCARHSALLFVPPRR